MTLESEREHLRATFESEPESFRELSQDVTLESDLDEVTHVLADP